MVFGGNNKKKSVEVAWKKDVGLLWIKCVVFIMCEVVVISTRVVTPRVTPKVAYVRMEESSTWLGKKGDIATPQKSCRFDIEVYVDVGLWAGEWPPKRKNRAMCQGIMGGSICLDCSDSVIKGGDLRQDGKEKLWGTSEVNRSKGGQRR